jgi:hypothetical protein
MSMPVKLDLNNLTNIMAHPSLKFIDKYSVYFWGTSKTGLSNDPVFKGVWISIILVQITTELAKRNLLFVVLLR